MWDFISVSPEFGDLKNHPLGTGSGATLQGNRSEGYEVYVTVPSSYRGLRGLTKLQARCAGENCPGEISPKMGTFHGKLI